MTTLNYIQPGSYRIHWFVKYTRKGNQYILKDLDGAICDVPVLCSSHKEADARLVFHAVYASLISPDKSVCVVSDNTDANIILLSTALQMKGTLFIFVKEHLKVARANIAAKTFLLPWCNRMRVYIPIL